jgi:hypothetical protein
MLAYLQTSGLATDRKLRLFACACCRRIPGLFPKGAAEAVLLTAERFADGEATKEGVTAVMRRVACIPEEHAHHRVQGLLWWEVVTGALGPTKKVGRVVSRVNGSVHQAANDRTAVLRAPAGEESRAARESWAVAEAAVARERAHQCRLLRDLFPHQSGTCDPASLPADVRGLAHAAYEERVLPSGELDPARLAILADALEEAGCTEAAILDHLRGAGPHVRGCWPVDLLTGR